MHHLNVQRIGLEASSLLAIKEERQEKGAITEKTARQGATHVEEQLGENANGTRGKVNNSERRGRCEGMRGWQLPGDAHKVFIFGKAAGNSSNAASESPSTPLRSTPPLLLHSFERSWYFSGVRMLPSNATSSCSPIRCLSACITSGATEPTHAQAGSISQEAEGEVRKGHLCCSYEVRSTAFALQARRLEAPTKLC